VAWQHAQCGLVKAANFTEKGVVYLLHRARLGPTLDKALPQGTRQRRPVLVGLAALVVFLIVLGPYLLLRHRDDTGMPIVQEDPSLPTPVVAAKAPPLSMVVQLGHADSLTSVALSHDGRFLATGSKDSTARLWEVATGKELRTFKGHAGAVTCVAFSEDDATLATGSADWTARLWNVADGQEIHQFHQHSDAITSVIFSRDGKWLITTAGDKTARKWDLATKDTKTLFKGHTAAITSAALSADGKWLATGSADKSARIWDLATGIEPPPKDAARFFTHPAAVTAVAFSKEGKWLATACADRIARVFKTEMGQEFRNFTVPPKSDMRFVAFSLDNKTLISGGDKTRLWDLTAEPVKPVPEKPGKEMQPPTLPGSMSAMLLSKDGQWLVTANADGGADRTASIRELPSGKPLRLFQGQAAPVQCVAFSRDGKWLVTGSDDKSAHLWKMPSGTELRTFPETSFIRSAALSPDGRWLLVGRGDGIRLWDTASFKDVRTFAGTGPLSLNGSGTLLATAQNDNAARLWELASGKEVHVFKDRHAANITSLALSADGNWLVTASSDKTWLWDASKGQEVHAFPVPSAVLSVAIAGDGKRLVTGSDDNSARLWDAAAVKEIRSFKDAGPVRCLALSADGKWLATAGSNDGNARLWDVDTGSELCIFRGHAGRITSLAMSNDRRYLASSSADGTTRLWDLASGRELCRLISFRDQTWAVVDSEGRYDSFNDGNAAQGLYWIDGLTITPIETQTRDRFHDSGLLAKYLNFNADRPRSLRE
jgi:WD40 repeat protein